MRLPALTLIGSLVLGAATLSAQAAPLAPALDTRNANIVQVFGGCGFGFHPVPGHWSRWRGAWVPPHCAPNGGGYYGGGYYGGGYYGGGYPHWHRHHYWWGY